MTRDNTTLPGSTCPMPVDASSTIRLAHGGGGRLMHRLIEEVFLPAFRHPALAVQHDGAVVRIDGVPLAFATDSYVVSPFRFPGGDIGTLAVHGTVNDLAMCGARPLFLSAGMILEEGFPMDALTEIVASMQRAAAAAGVAIVTGDTKVVDRGKGDGIFINTAGIGHVVATRPIHPAAMREGDAVLLSGDVGRHGVAIMAAREGLAFETPLASDTAPLAAPVLALLDAGIHVHCLRDATRGGLATVLIELAQRSGLAIHAEESAIPVADAVRGACEMLGLDPLYVANEGRFVAVLPSEEAPRALALLRRHAPCQDAAAIGRVAKTPAGRVSLRGELGSARMLEMLSGEQLPRIC